MSANSDDPKPSLESLLAQALHGVDPASGSIVPPLQPGTTFQRLPDGSAPQGRVYGRDHGVTLQQAEEMLAELEGGEEALLFASGMAAAMAVVQSLKPGDRIAAPSVMYWALRSWMVAFADTWGLAIDLFDAEEGEEGLEKVIRPGETKLVWIETPANPTWHLLDIRRCAHLAHQAGALLAVDSTVSTPVLTQPLELGADIVMHSATKYLGGHSDLLAGVLVTRRRDGFWQRLREQHLNGGGVLGAFECWLLIRSLRTLFVRVRQASTSALTIARHFEGHPGLEAVLYPGLPSHPRHDVALRQMAGGFGGMLSLRCKGGLFVRATSLGGVESLIEHRKAVEGAESPIPDDLLRLSVGLERPEDLIADLEQALAKA